jgi:hypothetical protein
MKRALRVASGIAAVVFLLSAPGAAARLDPSGRSAFDEYTAAVEARMERQHASPETFIAVLNGSSSHRSQTLQQLESGEVIIESVLDRPKPVPGGLVHHWRGTAFIAGARSKDMLALLRDYDGLPRHYGPEIESARVLSEHLGSAALAIRMKRKKVVTVVLDGEYDVQTQLLSANRGSSTSRSRHIWEVDAAGTAHERRMKEGDDDGFLWRLNSYWSFLEVPGGLLIECEAVSLTRDIPAGLNWLAGPVVDELPRESLEFTMQATRNALAVQTAKEIER